MYISDTITTGYKICTKGIACTLSQTVKHSSITLATLLHDLAHTYMHA